MTRLDVTSRSSNLPVKFGNAANLKTVSGLGVAALGSYLAYSIFKNSWPGSESIAQQAKAAVLQKKQDEFLRYGWGRHSGYQNSDQMATGFKRFMLYGPMDIKLRWEEGGAYWNSIFQNVIARNWVPMLLTGAGVYLAAGNKMFKPFAAAGRGLWKVAQKIFANPNPNGIVRRCLRGLGRAAKTVCTKFIKAPMQYKLVAGLMGLMGWFAWGRLMGSYNGQNQEELFRDFVSTKNPY